MKPRIKEMIILANKILTLEDMEKIKNTSYADLIQNGTIKQMAYELDQYKQIEEELGISLITLFKALKQGSMYIKEAYCCDTGEVYTMEPKDFLYVDWLIPIFTDTKDHEIEDYFVDFANQWCFNFEYDIDGTGYDYSWYLVKLKDYGKAWALTKEELL